MIGQKVMHEEQRKVVVRKKGLNFIVASLNMEGNQLVQIEDLEPVRCYKCGRLGETVICRKCHTKEENNRERKQWT